MDNAVIMLSHEISPTNLANCNSEPCPVLDQEPILLTFYERKLLPSSHNIGNLRVSTTLEL